MRTLFTNAAIVAFGLTLAVPAGAQLEPEIDWAAKIESDLRFRLAEESVGSWYDQVKLPAGVARNQNQLGARISAVMGDVSAKADFDFVLYGQPERLEGLGDLSRREKLDPYRVDVHSLYLQVKDLFVDGLDLRAGQQLVLWGVGDQFNPTNNLNADDLEDPLKFGDQQGNMMVKLDYWLDEDWAVSAVLVPIFRPALLPRSSALGLAQVDRLPMADEFVRHRIHAENALASDLASHPVVISDVKTVMPEAAFENMQFAFRIGGTLKGHDLALSYYHGRSDFPQALSNHIRQDATPMCNPADASDCIEGRLLQDVALHYPRMHVYGLNLAGEIGALKSLSNKLRAIGYRLETALIVPGEHASPEQSTMRITTEALNLAGLEFPAGEYDYPGGAYPLVIDKTPFLKWTLGLDYTFNEHVYLNMQWVHGLVDEFGAGDFITEGYASRGGGVSTEASETLDCAFVDRDGTRCARELLAPRLGDYLVAGMDFRFRQQKALLRLFTLFALNGIYETRYDEGQGQRVRSHHSMFSKQGFAAVLYPDFNYNFGNGLELGGGALIALGEPHSKFGDPAAGGSLVFTRGRYSF